MKRLNFLMCACLLILAAAFAACDNVNSKYAQARAIEQAVADGEATPQQMAELYDLYDAIVSSAAEERQKGDAYYRLAYFDPATKQIADKPNQDLVLKAAQAGVVEAQGEMARVYLNDGKNAEALAILGGVPDDPADVNSYPGANSMQPQAAVPGDTSDPDPFFYMPNSDVWGVLFYEGAPGLPQNIDLACKCLATGGIDGRAQELSDCLAFEKRRQLYSGHLNLIKNIYPQRTRNDLDPAVYRPEGAGFAAMRAAIRHYDAARRLGSDFPGLDSLIALLQRYVDTYDYYKERGDNYYDGTCWATNTNLRYTGVQKTYGNLDGINMHSWRMHLDGRDEDKVAYMQLGDVKDLGFTSRYFVGEMLEVYCMHNAFTIFLGEKSVERDFLDVRNGDPVSGFLYSSDGSITEY